jgi:hypothetical protein
MLLRSIRPTRARAGLHTSLNVRQQIRAHRPVRLFLLLLPPDLAPVGEEQELPQRVHGLALVELGVVIRKILR